MNICKNDIFRLKKLGGIEQNTTKQQFLFYFPITFHGQRYLNNREYEITIFHYHDKTHPHYIVARMQEEKKKKHAIEFHIKQQKYSPFFSQDLIFSTLL